MGEREGGLMEDNGEREEVGGGEVGKEGERGKGEGVRFVK